MKEKIISRLQEALGAVYVHVEDQSHLHRGHQENRPGGGHYALTVVSDRFRGMPLLERHRQVYGALGDYFKTEMHAAALKVYTTDEWRVKGRKEPR